jgi:transcriptional regulator GlxA family with amidase domain
MEVVILALDGVADLGLASVLQAFGMANDMRGQFDDPPDPWRVRTAAPGAGVRTGCGLLVATTPLAEVGHADLVVVTAPANRPVYEWLAAARDGGVELAAACTGTFFLAESGVLDGVTATTSWWLGPTMRRRYPRVDVDESRALCRTDGVSTAGAALMHLDLTLALVADRSPALAETVSRYLLTGDRRTQSASSIPAVIARGDSLVAEFERWVRAHLGEPFAIATAATELNVTVRSLQRATRAEIGMSPSDFVDEIRLERATRLLRQTSLTVDAVAAKVGYLNGGTLRSLYRRRRDRSIAEVRGSGDSWSFTGGTRR